MPINPFDWHPDAVRARTYFAQPITIFGTELKSFLLAKIRERFSDDVIVDPDTPEHQAGYARSGMGYYLEEVIPGCRRVVFLAFRDGMIGAGVYAEVQKVIAAGGTVFEIFPNGAIVERAGLDPARKLSVDETRSRIRGEDRSLKPY